MSQYLLSVHTAAGGAPRKPMTPEDMQMFMGRITSLETEMKESGAFVFTGRLHDPAAATVVRSSDSGVVMTDGPYVESKEHIGGFYIINADDLDAALAWGAKVTEAVGAPIEVWPFVDTRGA
jgi:hypothetical protein